MGKYSSYILYLLISVLVVILHINDPQTLSNLQRSVNDALGELTAPDGVRPNVVLVTIDGQALNEYGAWPWNRDLIADVLAATAGGEPKVILVDLDLSEDTRQDSLGYTDILTGQLSWIDNAVLTYDIALSTYRSNRTNSPEHLFNYSLTIDNPLGMMDEESSLLVRKVFLPAEKLMQTRAYLGFDYTMPDEDRILRHQQMVMNFEGYYYPSASLLAAAVYLDVPPQDILVIEEENVLLGSETRIPISGKGGYRISPVPTSSFTTFSAADILGENFDYSQLKDKMVLIGIDDFAYTETFDTPVQKEMPALVVKAGVIENIVNGNMLTYRGSRAAQDLILLFILGGLCAFILPQVSVLYRLVILLCGLIILGNVNYFMVSSLHTVPNMIYIALELVLFMIVSVVLESSLLTGESAARPTPLKKKPPRVVPERHQADGTDPLPPVREIKASPSDPEQEPTAALGLEDQTPFDHQAIQLEQKPDETAATPEAPTPANEQTTSVDAEEPPHAPEIVSPLSIQQNAAETPLQQDDSDKVPFFQQQEDMKNLGRYQITGVLGKGAMGTVYKGIDPAINRPVALKTIRLDFVIDPEEMAELKERLHREAQAAGKLSHPNIVTIYDVGSEGPLQYIAMECLEGQTLEDMIKKKAKFNYRIIAQIIMQICSALEYAHEQGIVHRDIKPANIMILKDYRIKVMDFGIARVDSHSMTKTGIAMGTPNYISPEQLKGQATDHRADLFSLGVVMYELLLGRRPFKGDSITSLIYSVINHQPQKPSNINPQIPLLFDRIIGRAIMKEPNERYQKASDIMADLADFVEAFSTKT